jgi:hypothetical protein
MSDVRARFDGYVRARVIWPDGLSWSESNDAAPYV